MKGNPSIDWFLSHPSSVFVCLSVNGSGLGGHASSLEEGSSPETVRGSGPSCPNTIAMAQAATWRGQVDPCGAVLDALPELTSRWPYGLSKLRY